MGVRVTQMCTTGGNNAAAVVLEPTVQIDSFYLFVVAGLSDVWGRGRQCGTPTSGPPDLAGSTMLPATAAPQPVNARELEITGSPDGDNG